MVAATEGPPKAAELQLSKKLNHVCTLCDREQLYQRRAELCCLSWTAASTSRALEGRAICCCQV